MKWCTTLVVLFLAAALVGVPAQAQLVNMVSNGGFETDNPSLWTAEPGTSAGAAVTWATDQAMGGTHSLKIVKPNTGGMARWISGNNVRYWVTSIPAAVDIKLGAWVKTSGVNTSPANDAAKWQIKYWFYDASDALIGGVPFVLDVDQSVATKDWYADTNGVATVNLPVDAVKLLISAEGGANATGTVWFDTFIFVGRAGAWAGQNWNGFVDAGEGWQYWISPGGGNDGQSNFGASGVTQEEKRTGNSSLKIVALPGRGDGEAVFFTETIPIPPNSMGKKYLLSAWVMTKDIIRDSVFNAECQLGYTWTWHTKMFADGGGWNENAGADFRFTLKDNSTGWTQYAAVMEVPNNEAQAVSIRARSWHMWTGVSYWDDFTMNDVLSGVVSVDGKNPIVDMSGIPTQVRLHRNYPNPFNPSTIISYDVPTAGSVKIEIFNILGQSVRTLVNTDQIPGTWKVEWNGTNDRGTVVPSGVYFVRFSASGVSLTGKMLLAK
jgi:hypothetical protein